MSSERQAALAAAFGKSVPRERSSNEEKIRIPLGGTGDQRTQVFPEFLGSGAGLCHGSDEKGAHARIFLLVHALIVISNIAGDAAQRRFDVLLFWALDRLTREGALQTLQYLNRLASYGVAFRSFREPYIDSCGSFSDAVIAILGTIAKQEKARISERVQAGMNRVKVQGTRSGRGVQQGLARKRFDRSVNQSRKRPTE